MNSDTIDTNGAYSRQRNDEFDLPTLTEFQNSKTDALELLNFSSRTPAAATLSTKKSRSKSLLLHTDMKRKSNGMKRFSVRSSSITSNPDAPNETKNSKVKKSSTMRRLSRNSFSSIPSFSSLPSPSRSKKRKYLVLLKGNPVVSISARGCDTLEKVRKRLASSPDNIDALCSAAAGVSVTFMDLQFKHGELVLVPASQESSVLLSDCLSANGDIVLGHISTQSKSNEPKSEAEVLPPSIKRVFLTCRRISNQFRKADQPDVIHILQLVDTLASLVKDLSNTPDLFLTKAQAPLSDLEELLRRALRRNTALDVWYHLPSDRFAYAQIISRIQAELPEPASSSLVICFPPEPEDVISLRDKIKVATLRCLSDSQHADLRTRLAKHLCIAESDLLYQLRCHSKASTAPLKQPAKNKIQSKNSTSAKPKTTKLSRPGSSSEIRDLTSILAPQHNENKTIIADHTARLTTPGMRQWAIQSFDEWIEEPRNRKHRISVLAGPSGTGKSAIASKIVRDRPNVVLAHYFIRHDDVKSCLAKSMLLSIAHQMAIRFPEYRARLVKVITEDKLTREALLSDRITLSTLFTEFIETPLHLIKTIDPKDRHVIVIDGLDECYRSTLSPSPQPESNGSSNVSRPNPKTIERSYSTTTGSASTGRNEILDVIQKYFTRIPPWLNLYVTTRPSLTILKKLKKFNARMEDPTVNNPDDLRIFYKHLLLRYGLYKNQRQRDDLIECMVQNLIHKGQGSFLYAAMASNILSAAIPSCNEAKLILESLPARIDGLYIRELDRILNKKKGLVAAALGSPEAKIIEADNKNEHDQVSVVAQVLSLVSAAFEPLHRNILAALVGCTSGELQHTLDLVPTILMSTNDGRVRFFHKSARDFLIRESASNGGANTGGGMGKSSANSDNFMTALSRSNSIRRLSNDQMANIITSTDLFQDNSTGVSGNPWGFHVQQAHAFMSCCLLRLMKEDPIILRPASFDDGEEHTVKKDNDTCKTRDYVLRYAVSHLLSAGMKDEARKVLLDVAWLMARSDDGHGILNDYGLIEEDGDQVIKLLKRAIEFSLPTLSIDPRQLAGQLVGRLAASTIGGGRDSSVRLEISNLLRNLKSHDFGFDWWCPVGPTWDRAEEAFLRKLTGHTSAVQSVSWSDDGKRIVGASWDNTLRVWDTTGHCEQVLIGHDMPVWCVDWSPDCQSIVSGSLDKTLRIWDADTGECKCLMEGHDDSVWAVDWSKDGTKLASGSKDKCCRIWNLSGEIVQELVGHEGWVYAVAWSADGKQLLSGSTDNTIWIWTVLTGTCNKILEGHTDWVRSVAWANGDTQIISGSADRTVRVWAAQSGESEQVLTGHTDSVWSVAMCGDGRHVASSSTDGSVRIFDATTGRCEKTLEGHQGPVWSVAWSPDGTRVVSGSTDTSAIVWDASIEREDNLTGHSASVWSVDQSADGNRLVSGSADKSIRLWDASGNCIRAFTSHTGPIWSVCLSSDGRRILSGSTDNTARIYHVGTGEEKLVLTHPDSVWSGTWCNDDMEVCTASRDGLIRVFDAFDGKLVKQLGGHTADIRCIRWTKHGNRLASGSTDKTIRIWRIEDGKCEHVIKDCNSGVLSVAWSPDGEYLAAGSADKLVRVFQVTNSGCICKLTITGHTRRVNSVCWSPDGTKLVTGSTDKSVRITNVQTGKNVQIFTGHTGLGVYTVKWTSNGQHIISCSTDKTIRIWCTTSGRCLNVLTGHTGLGIYCVAWSEDGKKVCSGSRDRNIQIFNAETGECEQSLTGHTNWIYSVAWEKGGGRIASISDDNTTRIWKVETGECENIIEGSSSIPSDFDVASTSCTTRDLSLRSFKDEPVGIQYEKVQVFNERACGWKGKSVNFFQLIKTSHGK